MDTSTTCELVFKKKHKSKPVQFVSVEGGVQKRLETNLKHRKGCRLTEFDNLRNLSQTETPVKQDDAEKKCEHRRQQLEKWKQEKDKKKKEQAANKKKPFVTGVVHVPLKFVLPPPPKPMPSTSGRVTRSQAAKVTAKTEKPKVQSFAPKNASFRPPQLKNVTVPTLPTIKSKKEMKQVFTFDPVIPMTEKTTLPSKTTKSMIVASSKQATQEPIRRMNTRSRVTSTNDNIKVVKNKITKSPKKAKKITDKLVGIQIMESQIAVSNGSPIIHTRRSVIRQNSSEELRELDHNSPILPTTVTPSRLTPKTSIPKSESQSEEKLRSPKDAVALTTPEPTEVSKISPCVTMSRGKENARREMKKKLQEGLLDEDAGDIDNVQHFRRQMQSEIARLTRHCEEWDCVVSDNTDLPELVQEQVLSALGQARLLMSQKMQQFASLVDRCEVRDTGGPRVKYGDLQGFWDMVFIQIENVDLLFKKLERLRARNWAEDAPAPVEKKPAGRRPGAKSGKTASGKPSSAPSRLREMIAAARKAKQEQEPCSAEPASPATKTLTPAGHCKTFDAGFFSVQSPVRSPALATPRNRNRASLLRNVLSSEARKASASKQSASYAMLHASIIGKNVEIEGIMPLEQTPKLPAINLNATPARSILKSTTKSVKKSAKKSIKTVLFDASDDETTEMKTKEMEGNTDSGVSSMDVEQEPENKENQGRNKLVRQDALEDSPVVTRSRRKSMNTPKEEVPKRSSRRKKALQEAESNIIQEAQRQKSSKDEVTMTNDIPRRTRRSKVTEDLIDLGTPTPRRRTSRRGVTPVDV